MILRQRGGIDVIFAKNKNLYFEFTDDRGIISLFCFSSIGEKYQYVLMAVTPLELYKYLRRECGSGVMHGISINQFYEPIKFQNENIYIE